MKEIKNILICGLGAIGGYYASKIFANENYCLKVLVTQDRLNKYKNEPRVINEIEYDFDYILPDDVGFLPDLIIISTKSSGLNDVIINIKNFIKDDTIILSLLNGISSENQIAEIYGKYKVLYSFLLGHTFFRRGKYIDHDGNAKIYFGYPNGENREKIRVLSHCFNTIGLEYVICEDILNSMWNKFCFNCCVNQISALTRMTFGEMLQSKKCINIIKKICAEISAVARAEGIANSEYFYENTLKSLKLMLSDGKTSMLQDIEAGIKPEIDIFGKTVVALGGKYGISTPYNKIISDIIDLI